MRYAILLLLAAYCFQPTLVTPGQAPTVAAAANLRFALPELAAHFRRETGQDLRLSFGSSGNLRRQIVQGAPFELFLAANENYVLSLFYAGYTEDKGAVYAIGKLVLLVPGNSPLTTDGSLQDLNLALNDGRLGKLAIANPEHAPYGQRAQEVLQQTGLWERIQIRLVLGENAAQAAQFALSGAAQGAIVAQSLALSPQVLTRASFQPIPSDWHRPLRQRMVLLKGANKTAQEFYQYLQTPAAHAILGRFGFLPPGDER